MASATQTRAARRERHEVVRARIIEATLELASEAPFRDLTVDEIARQAGLSRSALYFYFRDKHEILTSATEQAAEELYREADRWWHGEGDPKVLVTEALRGVVSVYVKHATLLRIATEVSTYDEEVRGFWRDLIERFIEATAEHLRAERAADRIRPLDPLATAESLVWMIERCCYIYLSRTERSPDQLVETLVAIWIAALYELPVSGPR